jgi:alkylation response protein AidB-like acyl-CoA dehydrogenase
MAMAITEEQRAVQRAVSDATLRAGTIGTVRAMAAGAPDAWRAHWPELAGLGLFGIALPEELGGAGSGLDDQCAALEQAAFALVPGPVLPTVLAGLLLARHPELPVAKELVPALAGGSATAAVALSPGTLSTEPDGLVVSGTTGPVPMADHLILSASGTWFVVDPGQPGVTSTRQDSADPSCPVARVTLDRVQVDRLLPGLATEDVLDLAATLAAAEAAGVAGWCVRSAAEYAQVRRQFGKAIGSFQAVKHLCAEMLVRAELAAAVAWDAARAGGTGLASATAAAIALDAAVDNAKDCVQVLGGIGFTWEHDAHLYLRRALALRRTPRPRPPAARRGSRAHRRPPGPQPGRRNRPRNARHRFRDRRAFARTATSPARRVRLPDAALAAAVRVGRVPTGSADHRPGVGPCRRAPPRSGHRCLGGADDHQVRHRRPAGAVRSPDAAR